MDGEPKILINVCVTNLSYYYYLHIKTLYGIDVGYRSLKVRYNIKIFSK